MAKGAIATHGGNARPEPTPSDADALLSLVYDFLASRGEVAITGFGPGWLMVEYRGRTYEWDLKEAANAPRLLAAHDDDRPPSDQFPAIPAMGGGTDQLTADSGFSAGLLLASERLRVVDCDDCGTSPPVFSAGDDAEARLAMDFRRSTGAAGDHDIDPND